MLQLFNLFLIISFIYLKIENCSGNFYTSDQKNIYYIDIEQTVILFETFKDNLKII